jgi:predicted nucleic acid-binding Zn ribbon protein
MNSVSSLLPAVLRQMHLSQDLTEELVLSLWKNAVGDVLARNAKPSRLHQSTLIISVPSPTWKQQLHALRFEILKKLEQVLGKEHVLALEFRVDPYMEAVPASSTERVRPEISQPAPFELATSEDSELVRSLAAAAASYFTDRGRL